VLWAYTACGVGIQHTSTVLTISSKSLVDDALAFRAQPNPDKGAEEFAVGIWISRIARGVRASPPRVVRLVFAYKEYCPKPHSCATSGGVLISGTILLITDRRAAAPRGPDGRRLDLLMSIDIADMQIGWQYAATLESTYKGTS
jgi:hypothetical protein